MKNIRCYCSFFSVGVALLVGGLPAAGTPGPSLSVSNITMVAGKTFTLPLDGNDPSGLPLRFSVVSNSLSSLTAVLVTNRTLRLNTSITTATILTNFITSSYTTNISLGQGTNVLFVSGAGNAAYNGVYVWAPDSLSPIDNSTHGIYTNLDSSSAAFIGQHSSFSWQWDLAGDPSSADAYLSPDLINWTCNNGAAPAPQATFDGTTPGALLISTNGIATYSTNSSTATGDLMLELFEHLTPKTTARIISLANSHFYDGLTFHRVIQNFMAQGGDPNGNGTGGSGVTFDDEFVYGLTFEGFGQLAMANHGFQYAAPWGRDNNDSQFFITAPNLMVGGTPPPQYLNYRHTIFGQLTHGFDLLGQIMATPVDTNAAPLNSVTINSATVFTNRQAAVLYLTVPTNASGSATLVIQAQSTAGTTQRTVHVTIAANAVNDPPFFGPMPASLVTTQNVAIAFPAIWYGGSTNSLGVFDANTGMGLNNVQISLNNGYFVLTPTANFIGTMDLLFIINDGYDHNGDEYDSQRVLLTVIQPNIAAALNTPGVNWTSGDSTGGSATWYRETTTTHDGSAALQSGHLGLVTSSTNLYSWTEITTNGPGSLYFWWKASTGTNASLGLFVNGVLVSSITGVTGWQEYATYLSSTGSVRLTWAYVKSSGANGGADCGWLDQVTWSPCPYAQNVPQVFYQDPNGLLASWVLSSNGGFRFARILANTGGWTLKAAGDVNGDGVSDLLFQPTGSTDAACWIMNADGTVHDTYTWHNLEGEIKACGDYEGSNSAQLFQQAANGDVVYWRLDTNGVRQSSVSLGHMAGWKLRCVGDMDGDHKAEIFWQNAAGLVAVWSHNADGTIHSAIAFNTGGWALCALTDIDADGVGDLLWQDGVGNTGGWFMHSNCTARTASYWWNTGGWKLRAAGR